MTSLLLLSIRFIRCGYTVPITSGDETKFIETDSAFNGTTRFLDDEEREFSYSGCDELYSLKILVLLIMSICFTVFTCCMLVEQADAIESNTSKIARMKMKLGEDDGEYEKVAGDFNEMFGIGPFSTDGLRKGSGVSLHWFLPSAVRFPDDELDKIMGYEYRESWFAKIYDEDNDHRDIEEQSRKEPQEEDVENAIELVPIEKRLNRITKRIPKDENDDGSNHSNAFI